MLICLRTFCRSQNRHVTAGNVPQWPSATCPCVQLHGSWSVVKFKMLGRMRKSEFCEVVRPAKRTRKQEDATLDISVMLAATAEFQVLWHLANVLVVMHAPLHTCTPGARWCILTRHSGRACSFHEKCSMLSMTHYPASRNKKKFFILGRTRAYVSSVEILPWLSPRSCIHLYLSCTLGRAVRRFMLDNLFLIFRRPSLTQKKSHEDFFPHEETHEDSWGLMRILKSSWAVFTRNFAHGFLQNTSLLYKVIKVTV